jgi:hypothetical protein
LPTTLVAKRLKARLVKLDAYGVRTFAGDGRRDLLDGSFDM